MSDTCLVHGCEMQHDMRSGFTLCPECEAQPTSPERGPEKFLMGYDYPLHITPEQAPQVFRFAERYAAHVLADAIEAVEAEADLFGRGAAADPDGGEDARLMQSHLEHAVTILRDMKEK